MCYPELSREAPTHSFAVLQCFLGGHVSSLCPRFDLFFTKKKLTDGLFDCLLFFLTSAVADGLG